VVRKRDEWLISPNGKILGAQASFKVDLWDAATGVLLGRLGTATVSDSFTKFAFAPDSKSVAYVTRQLSVLLPENDLITVSLFDVATGKEFRQFGRFGARVSGVAFAPDGKTLATGSGYSIQLWDTNTGREVSPAEGHTSAVRGLAISPDGNTLATAGPDRPSMGRGDGTGVAPAWWPSGDGLVRELFA
jgi:WD40 repeat protein